MLLRSLRISWRTLRRYRGTTAINLLGLSVSLAVCFLVVLFLHQQWDLDRFHPNADRIYRVATTYAESGNRTARAPLPLATVIRDRASGVAAATQLLSANTFVVKGKTSVPVQALYADASFFDVFQGFHLRAGDRHSAFRKPNTAVLTLDATRRLFGSDADPLGKSFSLEGTETFTVTGVLAPSAGPTHLDRDIFLSYATVTPRAVGPGDWDNLSRWTYLRLADGTAPDAIAQFANDALERDAAPRTAAAYELRMESLSDIRFGGIQINPVSNRTQIPVYIYYFFLAIAVIVLLAAGFNYVNLTTAHSLQRAKEIGVRKTLGANRTHLRAQFLGESVLLCLLAAVIACPLLYTLVPLFSQLYFFELLELPPLTISLLETPELPLLFAGVAVLFGLAAGSYPAFVLSSARPAGVRRPSADLSSPFGRLSLRTLLIGAQFAVALLLVVTATTLYRQSAEMAGTDHVLRTENAVTVALQDVDPDRFRRAGRRLPDVDDVTVVDNLPFSEDWRRRYIRTGAGKASLLTFEYQSDTSFVRAMGARLAASQTDWAMPFMAEDGVLLNESAVRALGFDGPSAAIGATVFLNQTDDGEPIHARNVVGVLENFQFQGSYHLYAGGGGPTIPPLLLRRGTGAYRTAVVHSATGDLSATRERLETMWTSELETVYPFQARFYSDVIRERYGPLQDLASLVGFTAGLAMLITLLGLLSIAAHHVKTRTKEIGIRKALGATASSLVLLLSQNFLRLVGLAAVLTLPVAWLLNRWWLRYLPESVSVGSAVLVGAVGALLLLALLTVGSQTLRAARLDPVATLRDE